MGLYAEGALRGGLNITALLGLGTVLAVLIWVGIGRVNKSSGVSRCDDEALPCWEEFKNKKPAPKTRPRRYKPAPRRYVA